MKKILIPMLAVIFLSGCIIVPPGHHRDRGHDRYYN